jgi:hypothetical protein
MGTGRSRTIFIEDARRWHPRVCLLGATGCLRKARLRNVIAGPQFRLCSSPQGTFIDEISPIVNRTSKCPTLRDDIELLPNDAATYNADAGKHPRDLNWRRPDKIGGSRDPLNSLALALDSATPRPILTNP